MNFGKTLGTGIVVIAAVVSGTDRVMAQSSLEILVGAKFCRSIKDDAQRLKCFDGLIADKVENNKSPKAAEWEIKESKSPIDDSAEITAILQAQDSSGSIFFRCKEHRSEAAYVPGGSAYFADPSKIKAVVRIGDGKPFDTIWSPATNNRGIFAPSAIELLKSLADDQKLFLRAFTYSGAPADSLFELGKISAVREKIADACEWDKPKKH